MPRFYGEITKTEELDDGTLIVEGIASTDGVDSDGETITADAMKASIPDYMKFGAVREMHKASAAGTALSINVGDDGVTTIKTHIVDSEAVKKVKAGVYKGFSVGGKATQRDDLNKTIITGLNLIEVSLVDRPANPDAVITCYKAEGIESDDIQKVEPVDEVKKSFYGVSRLASLLADVQDFINYCEYECQYTDKNQDIPPQVMEAAKALGVALVALVNNEVAALGSETSKADTVDDIAKAGKRNSAGDLAKLKQIIQLAKDLGADSEVEEETKTTDKTATSDDLTKVSGELDVTKADLAKVEGERDTLKKRVTELEALPAAPKGSTKDISKAQDMAQETTTEIKPVRKHDGSVDETATLIKGAFLNPIRL